MTVIKALRWKSLAAAFLLFAIMAAPANADGMRSQRERAEASMLVTGELVVGPGGHVRQFSLDHLTSCRHR